MSPNKDETAVHDYGLSFIGSCCVDVSQSHVIFYVVSALQLGLYVRKQPNSLPRKSACFKRWQNIS